MLCDNISRASDGRLLFAGQDVNALADRWGTPLYLMDEDRIRLNCRMYTGAFRAAFGPDALPLYAGKAASFRRIYRIMAEEGLGIDAVSPGEIGTALAAGYPAEGIYYHGDGKTDADIAFALERGVGCFIVDNGDELIALSEQAAAAGKRQKVLLRITPGIDPHTYHAINTGAVDVKFGVPVETGQAMEFVRAALGMKSLEVAGLHCHVGSMVFDEDVFLRTIDLMVGFMALPRAQRRRRLRRALHRRRPDGGHPRAHRRGRRAAEGAHRGGLPAAAALSDGAGAQHRGRRGHDGLHGLQRQAHPGLQELRRHRRRHDRQPALLSLRRAVHRLRAIFDLAGRCCESGDIIQPAISLPAATARGDRIAVCTTGAYNYSMASNYNRFGRPPVVMLRGGESFLAVKRESVEDVLSLDL